MYVLKNMRFLWLLNTTHTDTISRIIIMMSLVLFLSNGHFCVPHSIASVAIDKKDNDRRLAKTTLTISLLISLLVTHLKDLHAQYEKHVMVIAIMFDVNVFGL